MSTTYKFTEGAFEGSISGFKNSFVAGGSGGSTSFPTGINIRSYTSVGIVSSLQFTLDSLDSTPMTLELTTASFAFGTYFDYEMSGSYDSIEAERVDGTNSFLSPSISDIRQFESLTLKIESIELDSSSFTTPYVLSGEILQFTFKDGEGNAWYTTPDMWDGGYSSFTMTAKLTEVIDTPDPEPEPDPDPDPEPEPEPDPDPDPEPEPDPTVLNNIYYRNKKVTEIYVHGVKVSKAFTFGKQVFGEIAII